MYVRFLVAFHVVIFFGSEAAERRDSQGPSGAHKTKQYHNINELCHSVKSPSLHLWLVHWLTHQAGHVEKRQGGEGEGKGKGDSKRLCKRTRKRKVKGDGREEGKGKAIDCDRESQGETVRERKSKRLRKRKPERRGKGKSGKGKASDCTRDKGNGKG